MIPKVSFATVGRKYDDLQREYAYFGWLSSGLKDPNFEVTFGIGTTAGRIDVDRSSFIEHARNTGQWWHVQRDTDVAIETPFAEFWKYIEQDRDDGFDCVITPLTSVQMRPMAYVADGVDMDREKPFPIEAGSAGLIALSRKALMHLEKLGEFVAEDGTRSPAYCMMNVQNGLGDPMTEDICLFANLKKGGIRSCADPRIRTRHMKLEYGIPSWRPAKEQLLQHGKLAVPVEILADRTPNLPGAKLEPTKGIVRDGEIMLDRPIPDSIRGWLWPFELWWLWRMAKGLGNLQVAGDLLEIGSYCGLSASALGQAGELTCIDTFLGGGDLPYADSRGEFDRNMQLMDLHPAVFVGKSQDVLPQLRQERRRFRLIFVDGSHEYANVKADLLGSWRVLSVGGALVVDDYVGFPEVQRACDEFGKFKPVSEGKSKMAVLMKIGRGMDG